MPYLTPQQQHRKDIHKAADLSVEWQNDWMQFQSSPTYTLAKSVVEKGEALLEEQNRLSLQLKPKTYVRHRMLIAEDFLSKSIGKNNPSRSERLHQSEATQKLQKFLDGL